MLLQDNGKNETKTNEMRKDASFWLHISHNSREKSKNDDEEEEAAAKEKKTYVHMRWVCIESKWSDIY